MGIRNSGPLANPHMGKSKLKISSDPYLDSFHSWLHSCSKQEQQMRTPAQPRVNLYVQVSLETDKLRRRLECDTGFSAARLVTEALHLLAKNVSNLAPQKPSRPVRR
jgi:hypothetical protein